MADETTNLAPAEQTTPDALASEATDVPTLTWEAPEYQHHPKQKGWYALFVVAVLLLGGLAFLVHYWSSLALLLVMAVALLVYANKEPRVLEYGLGEDGLSIDQRSYNFDQFRSFSVLAQPDWQTIDFEPVKRFSPRLSVPFEEPKREMLTAFLEQHLPRQDRQPDVIDQLTRLIRF